MGAAHACAIRRPPGSASAASGARVAGGVVCWGSPADGRTAAPRGALKAVCAGGRHSCGVAAASGRAVCWGSNSDGQLKVPGDVLTMVTCGKAHSCGIKVTPAPPPPLPCHPLPSTPPPMCQAERRFRVEAGGSRGRPKGIRPTDSRQGRPAARRLTHGGQYLSRFRIRPDGGYVGCTVYSVPSTVYRAAFDAAAAPCPHAAAPPTAPTRTAWTQAARPAADCPPVGPPTNRRPPAPRSSIHSPLSTVRVHLSTVRSQSIHTVHRYTVHGTVPVYGTLAIYPQSLVSPSPKPVAATSYP